MTVVHAGGPSAVAVSDPYATLRPAAIRHVRSTAHASPRRHRRRAGGGAGSPVDRPAVVVDHQRQFTTPGTRSRLLERPGHRRCYRRVVGMDWPDGRHGPAAGRRRPGPSWDAGRSGPATTGPAERQVSRRPERRPERRPRHRPDEVAAQAELASCSRATRAVPGPGRCPERARRVLSGVPVERCPERRSVCGRQTSAVSVFDRRTVLRPARPAAPARPWASISASTARRCPHLAHPWRGRSSPRSSAGSTSNSRHGRHAHTPVGTFAGPASIRPGKHGVVETDDWPGIARTPARWRSPLCRCENRCRWTVALPARWGRPPPPDAPRRRSCRHRWRAPVAQAVAVARIQGSPSWRLPLAAMGAGRSAWRHAPADGRRRTSTCRIGGFARSREMSRRRRPLGDPFGHA